MPTNLHSQYKRSRKPQYTNPSNIKIPIQPNRHHSQKRHPRHRQRYNRKQSNHPHRSPQQHPKRCPSHQMPTHVPQKPTHIIPIRRTTRRLQHLQTLSTKHHNHNKKLQLQRRQQKHQAHHPSPTPTNQTRTTISCRLLPQSRLLSENANISKDTFPPA